MWDDNVNIVSHLKHFKNVNINTLTLRICREPILSFHVASKRNAVAYLG